MLKKSIVVILAVIMAAGVLVGCGAGNNSDNGKLKIVCTIFPQYDWVRTIAGEDADNIELTLLLDSGTDLHSYQPTASDIVTVTGSDLFVYVGGESDSWVDEIITAAGKEPVKSIKMIDVIGSAAVKEEAVPGMQVDDADEAEEEEFDEHVWLSLKNADIICEAIAEALCELDPDNAQKYKTNCEAYRRELNVLDGEYLSTVQAAKRSIVLFADRFPFAYLAKDYKLTYYAAFSGCSAETEASFETISFLASTVNENALPVILITETSDGHIAKTVKSETKNKDQNILVMDALQSVTEAKLREGVSYIETMKKNLAVLTEALN